MAAPASSSSMVSPAAAGTETAGFSVIIVACGPLAAMAGVVYAVAVAQPVQSWTVLRSHDDFKALSDALAPVLLEGNNTLNNNNNINNNHNDDDDDDDDDNNNNVNNNTHGAMIVPEFPLPPEQPGAMVRVRNSLQLWLSAMLMHSSVRESAAIRQFLTIGANTIPHQYEGVAWTQFNTILPPIIPPPPSNPSSPTGVANGNFHSVTDVSSPSSSSGGVHHHHHHHQQQHQHQHHHGLTSHTNPNTPNQLDMDMDYMFLGEDDGSTPHHDGDGDLNDDDDGDDHLQAGEHGDDNDGNDQDYIPSAAERYKPTEEAVADEDEMDIMQYAGEVEMIDDIGSLAQSLGASHLGRSLQLQAERNQSTTTDHNNNSNDPQNGPPGSVLLSQQPGGVGIKMGPSVQRGAASSGGGIGSAMADALNNSSSYMTQQQHRPPISQLSSAPRLDSFKMLKVIGKGSFGKVFLVRENKTGEIYALKVLRKDNIIKRNQIEHTKTERSVLGYVKHPFIVGMNMAFQSSDKLYFVLDYCAGGELFFHLGKLGRFPEPRARFYAAEIVLAISYVHSLDIVYRDLKPENVLLDDKGHIRLTDFGLSKEGISSSSSGANSFCGTPEYLAPEILNRQGHGRAVDWWSLGALLYEMLTGLPPFYCSERERLFEKIRRSELSYPATVQPAARSLLKGLLTKDPTRRLGSGPEDAEEIKRHEFFAPIDWDKLVRGEIQPEWVPKIKGSLDTSQFDKEFTNMPIFSPQSMQRGVHGFGATPTTDNPFEGFTFTDHVFHGPPIARAGGTN